MRQTKLRPIISATMALILCAMVFFAVSSGPFKSIAAARNSTEEVLEVEPAKYVSQSSHSRKLKPRHLPQKLVLPEAIEAPQAVPDFPDALLSFWLRPPNLLRAPPVLL